ncbi:MAG: hypothetical protein Q9200_005077 [Gallowayella weberi]
MDCLDSDTLANSESLKASGCPAFDFWERKAGRPLATLLQRADYDLVAQYSYIHFFVDRIIPALGPANGLSSKQTRWKSFMTDDHTPIELSWEWGNPGSPPDIRYSIETIGTLAGKIADPFNTLATQRLLEQLQHSIPQIDLGWYDHFTQHLLPNAQDLIAYQESHATSLPTEPTSTSFIAFDQRRRGPMTVKAYFIPTVKAAFSGIPTYDLIIHAIHTLPQRRPETCQALRLLTNFIETHSRGAQLECEILGIDCTSPSTARLKIYLRSRQTSFDAVREVMTLGGRMDNAEPESAFNDLFELWQALFFSDKTTLPVAKSTELRHCDHRTAGILYYFNFSGDKAQPVAKVYLPVRHYARNDYQVAKALCGFMKRRMGQRWGRRYMDALREIL